MTTLWFLLLALMLTAYVVLDGFDLGVGAIYKLVARTAKSARWFDAPSVRSGMATRSG